MIVSVLGWVGCISMRPEVERDLVYTSNKREGEPGFAFPEGCPKGRCEGSEQIILFYFNFKAFDPG